MADKEKYLKDALEKKPQRKYRALGGFVFENGRIKWQKSFNCHDVNDILFAQLEESTDESDTKHQDGSDE